MTGTTAILVLRPAWSKDERYAWSDVGTFAALTVACLAASLVNPNGPRLLEFSLTMGLASDYIKQVVFEWASPLGATYARSYGREAAIGMFLLIWVGTCLKRQTAAVSGCGVGLVGLGDVRAGRPFPFVYRDFRLFSRGTQLAGCSRHPPKLAARQTSPHDRGGAIRIIAGIYLNLRLPVWGSQTSHGRLGAWRTYAL